MPTVVGVAGVAGAGELLMSLLGTDEESGSGSQPPAAEVIQRAV